MNHASAPGVVRPLLTGDDCSRVSLISVITDGMGVEYAHGFFVADLDWRPTWTVARALADTLAKWKLCGESFALYRLDDQGANHLRLKRNSPARSRQI